MSGATGGGPGPRKEQGDAASSSKHPPHTTENAVDAPVQQETEGAGDAPVLGSNASGHDKVSTEELEQPIRKESMYQQRPGEDKKWDPGEGNP